MDQQETKSLATALAENLKADLEVITVEFNKKAQELGASYGLTLITEVSFIIDTGINGQEG